MKTGTAVAVAVVATVGIVGVGVGMGYAVGRGNGSSSSYSMPASMMNGGVMGGAGGSMMQGGGMMGSGSSMTNGGMMGGGSMMGGTSAAVPPAIEGATAVTVTMDNLAFSPASLTAAVGQAVNITVRNADEIVHDMTIPAFGVHAVVQPGQSVTFGIRPTSAGTDPFLCTVAGHAQAGMRGVLAVTA